MASLKSAALNAPSRETLVGSVERVTFHNEENGFAVLKVKARGRRDLVAVVGHAAFISAGEFIHAVGVWLTDRTHGLQFKADTLKTTPPTTAEGIEKYLGSGMVRGIGPTLAKRIVAVFGEATFEIIEASPEKLKEVPGIGEFRAEKIAAGWAEQKAVRDIMVFLHSNGVGTSRAVRIFKTYGHDAIQVMTEDPYRLARDIKGIGFRTADAIAMKMGMTREAPQRVRAGISFALQEATDEGHCGLPVEPLVELATKLLEVDKTIVRAALAHELSHDEIVADAIGGEPCIFLRGLYFAERGVAERLLSLAKGAPPWPPIDADKAAPWVEKKTGKTLAASQRAALEIALGAKAALITGGPGVGKTTLLDAILRILAAKGVKILLGAPTGRAAKRMTEQTGIEAKTIHRLLEINPLHGGFTRNEENPLQCDLLVIDETSMVDISLMFAVMKAVPPKAALLLVGDVDQLPSVGPGQILSDIINSGAVPVARLTEVFRQAAESRIIVNAHRINGGEMPEWPKRGEDLDFWFVDAKDPEDGAAKVVARARSHSAAVRPRPDPRHPGFVSDAARRSRRAFAQRRSSEGAQSKLVHPNRKVRLGLRPRRQNHADRERLRPRSLQRRSWDRAAHRRKRGPTCRRLRRPRGPISFWRARCAASRLCDDDPQIARIRISRRGHHACDAALCDAGAKPRLHGGHARQASRRHRRPAPGDGDRRA